ncbi:polyadenylate-binding protein-interacting protein 7 isoform X1 [Musa acuminata AAA Group]|uniref:Smr domain-containing protein n=1 Tax=Musa acuminata subsp. malaccensis TaxID=214687 RepID=A0A804JFQ3_MUSAM|nr:PREDICTED: polyadenylate-binding protein-interacting protein 7-like isoform X1 [Musa acuminata subsp. malaccensis]
MNSSNKGLYGSKDLKLGSLNMANSLNPNAAEFVPSALKYAYGTAKSSGAAKLDLPGSSEKVVLDRSESDISNNSDDEVHKFWQHQLPDDITPDFEIVGQEELHEPGHLTLAGLSIHDGVEQSKFSTSMTDQILDMRQDLSSLSTDNINLSGKMRSPGSIYSREQSLVASMTSAADIWGKPMINGEQQGEGHQWDRDYNAGPVDNLIDDNVFLENSITDPIEFLSSQFPGFAAQSLADVYYGNGCDLDLTIEILTQLELQVDAGFGQKLNSQSLATPNFSPLDFPALPVADTLNGLSKYSGEEAHNGSNMYRYPSGISRGDIDFASTVRKLASQNSGHWRYERNGSADGAAGSSKNSQLLSNSYNGNNKMVFGDRWHGSRVSRSSPVWLETGEAVANIYSESREEARDFARLRNTCFEQARLAYLIGNKALAKELSMKGQLYSIQMKAAHEKAKETIYRKRNPQSREMQGYSRGQDHLIDLHGLHVTEAKHVLDHELRLLRSTARATGQRLQVMVCVGTGHHTKGTRTPARLPAAVEQYLLDEGLDYTHHQPGLFRVVIY